MALVILPFPVQWPGMSTRWGGSPAITAANVLDAAGEYSAMVVNADQAMVISHIWVYPQASTSGVATVSIETLTTGNPSGTLWNAGGGGSIGTTATLVAGTGQLIALAASATIAAGEDFAIVVRYVSGALTLGTAGTGSQPFSDSQVPYRVTNTTGSAVKSVGTALLLAIGSSTTTFYPIRNMYPVVNVITTGFNNTNSAARAVRFQVAFPCRVRGFRFFCAGNTGNHNIILMDDAGNELSNSSTAKTQANSSISSALQDSFFDNPVVLAIGTWYRAVIEPSSATNFNLCSLILPSADYRSAMPGGTNFHYATRASGSWTDSATDTVPILDLLIDQLDNGVSAGGGVPGNMTGGLQ